MTHFSSLTFYNTLRKKRVEDDTIAFYNSDNETLARSLLSIARQYRTIKEQSSCEYPTHPHKNNGVSLLVWHLMPDLAYRLGATDPTLFLAEERTHHKIITCEDRQHYRIITTKILRHLRSQKLNNFYDRSHNLKAVDLLKNPIENGHIVEIALSRLFPPHDSDQYIVKNGFANDIGFYLENAARLRANRFQRFWSPDLNQRNTYQRRPTKRLQSAYTSAINS